MDATQQILDDSILESEEDEEEKKVERGEPLAKLRVFKNEHISETELPLYLGENVLGRDPTTCSLPLVARSISKQHTVISISVFRAKGRHGDVAVEALVWDLGSMNGTRKGRFKLTPHVRYSLSDGESLVFADIPCQYASCAVDHRASQGDMQSPGHRATGRGRQAGTEKGKAQLRGSPKDQGLGWGSAEKGVNGGTNTPVAGVVAPGGEQGKTPVRLQPLSLEQTPTQPEMTLVPGSESESDGEQEGRKGRRGKFIVSDSDSHMSSPTCSTFLSPTHQVIPESPITPSSSSTAKNRPCKKVSFSEEDQDVEVAQQRANKKRTQEIVDDSEVEEEEKEKGSTAPGREETDKETCGRQVSEDQANVSVSAEDTFSPCGPAISPEKRLELNMDSDTDLEGEEEIGLCGRRRGEPVMTCNGEEPLPKGSPTDPLPDPHQFHMDSDTDVEEDDAVENDPKSMPASDVNRAPLDSIPVVQPTDIHLDSDTDVEDDDVPSGSAAKATAMTGQPAALPSSAQPVEFHLDSDTDVEEDPDTKTEDTTPRIEETHSRTHSICAKVRVELHMDSDTDEEVEHSGLAASKATEVAGDTKPLIATEPGAAVDILSHDDTDLEDEEDEAPAVAAVRESSSQARVPPDAAADATVREENDANVEEAGPGEAAGALWCSTPLESTEFRMEEMETQAFLKPADPFRSPLPPALGLAASSYSDIQEDEDLTVAETQSFVLESRDGQSRLHEDPNLDAATQAYGLETSSGEEQEEQSGPEASFQLGLSDSSHLQTHALATESTQAFGSLVDNAELEPTQAYGSLAPPERASVKGDLDLEATQAYGGGGRDSTWQPGLLGTGGRVDFALEATQAYIPEPLTDAVEEEREQMFDIASAKTLPTADGEGGDETQPLDFHITSAVSTAETLPLSAYEEEEEEEDLAGAKPPVPMSRGRARGQGEEEDTQPVEVLTHQYLSSAETQPMAATEQSDGDSNDTEEEDVVLVPLRRRGRSRRLIEEEETQTLSSSCLSTAETQPMSTHEADDEEEDGEEEKDSKPSLQKVKVQSQRVREGETAGPSGINSRPRRGRGARGEAEKKEEESSVPPKRQTRGKGKVLNTAGGGGGGRRGRVAPKEEVESEEEKVAGPVRRGRKSMKRLNEESEEKERLQRERREEEERIENERKEQTEKDRLEKEKIEKERLERILKESAEREWREQEERERLEKERKEIEERERMEREKIEREEKERLETEKREEQERMERERVEQELKDRFKREEKERVDMEKREEKERLERMRKEKEEQERLEQEKREREKEERLEREREEEERLENIRKEKEEQERLARERAEKERLERERLERQEKEKLEREKAEKEERERVEREKLEREERERMEREKLEREERERVERERVEREERERVEREKAETEERERLERERLEREEREKVKQERQEEESIKCKQAEKAKAQTEARAAETSTRGRRVTSRRTVAAPPIPEPEPDPDVPASRGRGRRKSARPPPVDAPQPSSTRRRTPAATAPPAAAELTVQDILSNDVPARRTRSRSSSTNSLNSEISTCSVASESRGGGGRGRKTADIAPKEEDIAPKKTPARGRKSKKVEDSSVPPTASVSQPHSVKVDSQEPGATRGRRRGRMSDSEPVAATAHEDQPPQVAEGTAEDLRAGGRKERSVKPESTVRVAETSEESDVSKGRGRGRKRDLEEELEDDVAIRRFKIPKGKAAVQRGRRKDPVEEEEEEEEKEEENPAPAPAPAGRRGRLSAAQGKHDPNEERGGDEGKTTEGSGAVERTSRGRPSAARRRKEPKGGEGSASNSMDQDSNAEAPEMPQTPGSRKRAAPIGSPAAEKTPRSYSPSSVVSPGSEGRRRATTQAHKVLFTGVVYEAWETTVSRLGGTAAKGVSDMTVLVTDKVRRTVKFLCAVARGVPVVTTDWLDKSGKAGGFLPPDGFLVKDAEEEKKFGFCLEESLRAASSRPLLQGYEIHVTKRVLPDPSNMKDIICCSGARFLPKMPSVHKTQTVVVSCQEDWSLCGPALATSLPVVSSEFLLTGVLQQRADLQAHVLPNPTAGPKAPGPKATGRGRPRKTP